MDTYLIYRLSGGASYRTDYSNASRTQLLNLRSLQWDPALLEAFGIAQTSLPEICDSNAYFGETTFGGLLKQPVPICSAMGDSHAALYAQGCHERGMVKTTYGTGSSIMMNLGPALQKSSCGLATSIAYASDGQVNYCLEGNINYTGAVISWLRDNLHLIDSPKDVEPLARLANPEDTTILVPAFTGLSAPYWANEAKATITGMTRTTGRNELCKAALESIAYQITDILSAMEKDSGMKIAELRVDGGPTRNAYLMQFQADLADTAVSVPDMEEFSALGVSYMAGKKAGIMDDSVFTSCERTVYRSEMSEEKRTEKKARWSDAIRRTL
jgi:glycerol kinase